MDKNLAAFLDQSAYTIEVQYQREDGKASRPYKFVTNIPGIKKGDFVVVNSRVTQDATPLHDTRMQTFTAGGTLTEALEDDVFSGVVMYGTVDVVRVVRVNKEVAIEPNDPKEYSWVIQKVNFDNFVATVNRNKQITSTAQAAYKRNLRRSFAERILGDMSQEEQDKLSKLLAPPSVPAHESGESK